MLKVHTRKLGNVAVVSVQGRIVNGETASLREVVDAQSTVKTVLLDLGRVSTIDASGLGLMLEMREQTQSKGMRFKLMNVTNLVSKVLAVTKLDSVFEWERDITFYTRYGDVFAWSCLGVVFLAIGRVTWSQSRRAAIRVRSVSPSGSNSSPTKKRK